jgi:hypothetical protein
MPGFPVTCSNCNHPLRDVNETPCPNCGDTRRTVHMQVATSMFTMVTSSVRLTLRKIEREVQTNWPLLSVLVAGDLLSTVPASPLSAVT